jgi:hypothetical protein
VRGIAAAMILLLAYGTIVHVVQVSTGLPRPYEWAPAWLAAYFVALTVLEPLAAGLLWARRALGLHLTTAILVTDALANGYAVYGLGTGGGVAHASQALISALAIGSVAVTPIMRRHLDPRPAATPRLRPGARSRSGPG